MESAAESAAAARVSRKKRAPGLAFTGHQTMVEIEEPHHHDVLCGRGVTINKWPGNESFRRLVGLNKEIYVSSTKRQKMAISRSIVEAVAAQDPPGRFLEKELATGQWTEIGHKKAIEKTSQALRDGAASLRKQLSADFGDPNFLNAVFDEHEDSNKDDSVNSSGDVVISSVDIGEGTEVESPPHTPKPDTFPVMDEVKSGAKTEDKRTDVVTFDSLLPEKKTVVTKRVSAKPSQNPTAKSLPVKRGLRRSRSNPCLASSSSKVYRKPKQISVPSTPMSTQNEKYSQVATSPRTPMSRYSASQPGSPMAWGNRQPYHENLDSRPIGPASAHSPYNYPLSPASDACYSFGTRYDKHGHDPGYCSRSYSYDHYVGYGAETRPDYHNSHSWSHHPSSPHPPPPASVSSAPAAPSYPWAYYSGYTPSRYLSSWSPAPYSPRASGSLPPGRHQFSPSGYRSDRPEQEPLHGQEEYHGYSPRYPHENRNPVQTERSPLWKSPHNGEYYNSPAPPGYATSFSDSVNTNTTSSLSVPSLGYEHRYYGSPQAQILSPRSRSSGGESPMRWPVSSRDFAPPESKSRMRIIRRRGKHAHPWEYNEGYRPKKRTSPTGEEKKVENDSVSASNHASTTCTSIHHSPSNDTKTDFSLRQENFASLAENEYDMVIDGCGPLGRPAGKIDSARSSPALTIRSSPLLARISVVAAFPDDSEHIEDIEMSPISQADHEDPTTLMELPENLMTLPISPCGPHDYPSVPRG